LARKRCFKWLEELRKANPGVVALLSECTQEGDGSLTFKPRNLVGYPASPVLPEGIGRFAPGATLGGPTTIVLPEGLKKFEPSRNGLGHVKVLGIPKSLTDFEFLRSIDTLPKLETLVLKHRSFANWDWETCFLLGSRGVTVELASGRQKDLRDKCGDYLSGLVIVSPPGAMIHL
jgi:hypothetical protein